MVDSGFMCLNHWPKTDKIIVGSLFLCPDPKAGKVYPSTKVYATNK